jgi:hypothetical protein
MVRSHSEYYTSMSVSGLPTFLISVKNMNLLSSSIKFDRFYTILQKNGGTDTKPMDKTEPQFLSDPMSDRKKKFSPTHINVSFRFNLHF